MLTIAVGGCSGESKLKLSHNKSVFFIEAAGRRRFGCGFLFLFPRRGEYLSKLYCIKVVLV